MINRLNRICLSLVAVLGASVASAEYTPYHELRQDHASIDAAIAAMPNSDLHGDLNRISALFTRSQVRDLGPNQYPLLPSNVVAGMTSALADLQADWADGSAALSLEQKLTLIQTIEVVASSRLVELYNTPPPAPCPCDFPNPCQRCFPFEFQPVIRELNGLVSLFYDDLNAIIADYNTHLDPDIALLPLAFTAGNFDTQLDRIREPAYLTIKGVESIDD